jgi:hypothetical protein
MPPAASQLERGGPDFLQHTQEKLWRRGVLGLDLSGFATKALGERSPYLGHVYCGAERKMIDDWSNYYLRCAGCRIGISDPWHTR